MTDRTTGTDARPVAPEEPASARGGIRLPIRFKILFLLVVLATVVSGVVSRTLISFFNEDKVTYIQDLNADIAANTAASVEFQIDAYRQRIDALITAFEASEEPGSRLSNLFHASEDLIFLAVYDEHRERVLRLDRAGHIIDSGVDLDEFIARRERLERPLDYIRSQGKLVANSSTSPELLTFAMTVPFHSERWGRDFAIRVDFDGQSLRRTMERTPGFDIYVVDRQGAIFAHPDAELMATRASVAASESVQAMLTNLGWTAGGTGEYRGPDGEEVLASYAVVRGPMLGVMVERPKRDAFAAADRLSRRSREAAILVIVIATVFSVFLSSALTRRLLKLSEAAKKLEKGQFDVRLESPSNDELGDLAHSVNLAARGLQERDDKLKTAYDQLLQSEKLAGFGKFSAGIAHEIKNPLTGIIGFAQIVTRRLPEGDPSRKSVALIEKEAKRCKTILDNLLKFTRKEGFNFEPVRLHGFVGELLELMAPQVNLHHAEVSTDLQASDDLIKGDKNQLQQVFMNLCMNALDAMEDQEDKRLWISTSDAEPGYVEVRVADNGTGIAEAVIRKVFDPFFTTKEQGKGTGLGLSVSYGIITNHGGQISVRNRDEGGAEFRVVIPVASNEVRGAERRQAEAGAIA